MIAIIPLTSIASSGEVRRMTRAYKPAKRDPYTKFISEEKVEIGKRAAEHGTAATIHACYPLPQREWVSFFPKIESRLKLMFQNRSLHRYTYFQVTDTKLRGKSNVGQTLLRKTSLFASLISWFEMNP